MPVTDETMEKAAAADAVLLGAVGGPKWAKVDFAVRPEAGLLRLRKDLGLFANLRPAICFEPLADASSLKRELVAGLDIMILRELTGGVYFGEPRGITTLPDGTRRGVNTQVYETGEIRRIARVAFDLAKKRDNRVCSSEKANVMESGLLWREEVEYVHENEFPEVELSHMYADALGMQLVRAPKQFDVIVTDNLFGDLLSDVAAMLTGLARHAALGFARRGRRVRQAPRDVRAGAWLSSGYRRQEHRQSDRDHSQLRHGAALLLRSRRSRRSDRARCQHGPGGRPAHSRHHAAGQGQGLDVGDGRLDPEGAGQAQQLRRGVAAPDLTEGATNMAYTLAIVGATGTVGREILNVLAERGFPEDSVTWLALRESVGVELSYGFEHTLKCKALEHHDFSKTDIAIFVAGPEVAEKWAPAAAKAGCVAIDSSTFFRMQDTVPLVVPEANADALAGYEKRRIVACPSGIAAQLAVVLKPLHEMGVARRVVVDTYESVAEAGNAAMDELFQQTRGIFVNDAVVTEEFTKQIAFNVIPHIDDFMQDGSTREERRLAAETRKILSADIKIAATCVRVPVFVGHAMAVHIEFEREVTVSDARRLLRAAPGCIVIDKREDGGYMTPVEAVGEFATFISRIRQDKTVEHGLSLWIVADNLRNAAALTGVQIAEILAGRYLKKPD